MPSPAHSEVQKRTLAEWLRRLETLHPTEIELGLDRISRVAERMGLSSPPFPIVTIAGTNGKGSCIAMLDAILRAAGYRTAVYTSPHLERYNERIRVDDRQAEDADLCAAFERVDRARGEVSLTYFEFGTLAAMDLFVAARPEIALLEVGLGGRLDAVNLWDPDVALVSTVDLDHQAWLGADREAIGAEKAGIFRPDRPAVCGDRNPPQSLVRHAHRIGAPLYRLGREFDHRPEPGGWGYRGPAAERHGLPAPALHGAAQVDNAAAVLMVLELLAQRFPLAQQAVREGLQTVRLAGRFQVWPGSPARILDVAHNPQAARLLAHTLRARPHPGRTLAVLGMLGDKDVSGVIEAMLPVVDEWFIVGLSAPRAASPADLVRAIRALARRVPVRVQTDVADGLAAAEAASTLDDRILVFGSFYTVADALAILTRNATPD